jgi:hypothetical protein
LSRLPDKYRAVLVLCDLEGKTRTEAAVQLGLPEGTIASRLAPKASANARLAARPSARALNRRLPTEGSRAHDGTSPHR